MKKKLEAELISIAHRILKLKNKSELIQLHSEAQKVYEKLSVLLFIDEIFSEPQPTIGRKETLEILETAFDNQDKPNSPSKDEPLQSEDQPASIVESAGDIRNDVDSEDDNSVSKGDDDAASNHGSEEEDAEIVLTKPTTNSDTDGDIIEENKPNTGGDEAAVTKESDAETVIKTGANFVEPESIEEVAKATAEPDTKSEDHFKPTFEWGFEPKEETKETPSADVKAGQIAFDDLLGSGYVDPIFVKPEENVPHTIENLPGIPKFPDVRKDDAEIADKTVTLNDRLSKGITVGLNDRIAFVQNLFGNSTEEYNRVLSQLITFNTFAEAQEFIDNMVKPDYNNWEGKEEYATRFMEVVEKKFT